MCVCVSVRSQVKHDDLREAAATFVLELSNGKEFLADCKERQITTLEANIKQVNEDLQAMTASIAQGESCAHTHTHIHTLWQRTLNRSTRTYRL